MSWELEKLPLVKLMILGDAQVGKTSVMNRYIEDMFQSRTMCTIAIEFRSKVVEVKNKLIKVQIWDTAGQEKFRVITKSFYQRAMGIVLVFDVADRESFNHVGFWMKEVFEFMVTQVIDRGISVQTEMQLDKHNNRHKDKLRSKCMCNWLQHKNV